MASCPENKGEELIWEQKVQGKGREAEAGKEVELRMGGLTGQQRGPAGRGMAVRKAWKSA